MVYHREDLESRSSPTHLRDDPKIPVLEFGRALRLATASERIAMRLLLSLLIAGSFALAQEGMVPVVIETEMGTIEAVIDTVHAPISGKNFLRYVDAGLFDGGRFHRTVKLNPDNQPNNEVKIEVVQAGRRPDTEGFPPIPLERTSQSGLSHKNGTLSMARREPDSGTSDFSICIGDQPELNFGGKRNPDGQGFAAFGQVTSGMDVAKKMQMAPAEEQRLTPPIKILRIRRK
jgi:peptidyl-prolyl cis-trans isomerase A (cyclophilin A)